MKLGLLASKEISEYRIRTLKPILDDTSFSVEVAIIDCRKEKSFKQKLIKNFKLKRGGYIFIMALKKIFVKKEADLSMKEYCERNNIFYIESEKPYSREIVSKIREYKLDALILIGGFGIVKEPLISLTPFGILSYHHGDMRKYRGMPHCFWELYNKEKKLGVTVQILSSGLDCGIPVAEISVDIHTKDSLNQLKERAYEKSENLMYSAVNKLSDPEFIPIKVENFGKIYTLPNIKQWMIFNFKILWRKINPFI